MNDNILPPDGFRHTGNTYPLDRQQLLEYVLHKMANYDSAVQRAQSGSQDVNSIPEQNPYTDNLLFVTPENKTVQVPKDIHKEAIRLWIQQNQITPTQEVPQEVHQEQMVVPNTELSVYDQYPHMPRDIPAEMIPHIAQQFPAEMTSQMLQHPQGGSSSGLQGNKKLILIGVVVIALIGYYYYKNHMKK